MDTRVTNLRKLHLQLLFGPGIISCVGPPASGKTTTVMRMLYEHGGGASTVIGPTDDGTRAAAQEKAAAAAALAAKAKRKGAGAVPGVVAAATRRKREEEEKEQHGGSKNSAVIVYISAASATSASHAIRRLGREARRCARAWATMKGTSVGGDALGGPKAAYSAAEARSIEGAVAAASVDIRAAYEELHAAVAARNRVRSATEQYHPPTLHLVIDDIDLVHIQRRQQSQQQQQSRSKGIHTLNREDPPGGVGGTGWESFDQALQALYRNVALANHNARGKKWIKPQLPGGTTGNAQQQQQQQAQQQLLTNTEHLAAPLMLHMEDSEVSVPVRTSAGIYFWCISQAPMQARTMMERTVCFVMPNTAEIAAEAALLVHAALRQGHQSTTAAAMVQQQQQQSAAMNSNNSSSNNAEPDDALLNQIYDVECFEKAALYFCTTAPTCHSITVRDCRLLASRIASIVRRLQATSRILPRLTPPVLARGWNAAVVAEEQAVARRDADNNQQQQQAALAKKSATAGDNNSNLTTANSTTATTSAAANSLNGPASSLVASMRCLPVVAQILAVASFFCGALSEPQLRAVLGDTAGAVKQIRQSAEGKANAQPVSAAKHMFGAESLAWVYDAVLKLATSIQESAMGTGRNETTISLFGEALLFPTGDNNNNNNNKGKASEAKITATTKASDNSNSFFTSTSECCWIPGRLSSCLPSGVIALHHLLALEALGAVVPVRGALSVKYRCALLPGDAATLAAQWGVDLWQLITGATVRGGA